MDAKIIGVAKALKDARQRRIIVVDEKEYPVEIISTTDMDNNVVASGKDPNSMKTKDVMASPISVVCDIDCELKEA